MRPKEPEPTKEPEQPEQGDEGESAAGSLEGMSLSAIIDAVYAIKPVELMLATSQVDIANADSLKYSTGLDSADKIKEAAVSEAMIGSQAYSLVLVRVNDSADAADVAQSMKDGINTAKWICVQADDLKVSAYNDLVLLIMVDSQLSDTVTSAEITDAFKEICGGTLSVEL